MTISKDNTRVLVTIPKELREELEEEAAKENRSLSNYIQTLLLNRKKETHD